MKTTRLVIVFCVLAAVLLAAQVGAWAAVEDEFGPNEAKLGDEAAAEIAKEYKLSDNAEDLKRVRTMGEKIAEVANKKTVDALYGSPKITPFDFKFDIIEDDDVNAFCVPGGHIYVYRGLLDFVQSDDELAGVLAHEITHACHHHMVYLLKKQAALNNTMAIALLAAMLGGSGTASGSDMYNVVLGVQLYQIAKLNGYGMQAERDSDHGAVFYMHEAGYNPVGLLTFMERLARRPNLIEYGIYRSHPLDADRVRAAMRLIQEMGLPINRRATTDAIDAEVRTDKADGVDVPGVVIQGAVIYRPSPRGEKSSAQQAREVADRINSALDAGLKMHELRVNPAAAEVTARGKVLLTVSEGDAKLMDKTRVQVAQTAAAAIRNVLFKQMVETLH